MSLKHFMAIILLAAMMVSGTACSGLDAQRESLGRHQRLWVQQSVDSYQYRLKINCFCPPEVTDPVIVIVRDRVVISVSYVATGTSAESKYFEKYDTIDEMFLVIDDAFKREADEISITYEETLGFPTQIYIDFVKQAIDDEIKYTVSEFQTLK